MGAGGYADNRHEDAYTSLGEVIGEEIEEDLVNRIFAKFCMGK